MNKEVIAFDIGGTNMRAALVRNHKIIKYLVVPTPKDKYYFLNQMESFIEELMSKNVKGIGIGIAGPVKDGKLMNAPNLPLKNFDLKKFVHQKFKVRVEVSNDAACFTAAESRLGVKTKNFILLTIGTGIGGGVVISGKPYRGMGMGGEFGHMYLRGQEWESLWKETKGKIDDRFGKGTLVSSLCKHKSKRGDALLHEAADYFGEGIASLIDAFDPEVVLLGGGVEESGSYFLDMIKASVKKYSFLPKTTKIQWTTIKKPGIIGSSLLID